MANTLFKSSFFFAANILKPFQKKGLLKKSFVFFLGLFLLPIGLFSQSGIDESYAVVNLNGAGNVLYDLNFNSANPDFDGLNLGTFLSSNTLVLNGAKNKIHKCGVDNIVDGKIYYRVYKIGNSAPAFSAVSLTYQGLPSGPGDIPTLSPCAGVNQYWEANAANINILADPNITGPGSYYLEVYTSADYTGISGSGTHMVNNSNSNYKAQFTLSADCISGISVSPSSSQSLCQSGLPNQLTATATRISNFGAGSITYEWYSNPVNSNTGGTLVKTTTTTSAALTDSYTPSAAVAGTTYYYCTVTNGDAGCTPAIFSSVPVEVTVHPLLAPSVTASINPGNNICAGTAVTFTAAPVNGGSNPTYQWQVNEVNVAGATSQTFVTSTLTNSQRVRVIMTPDPVTLPCPSAATATSPIITMSVNPVLVPSVTISASATTICPGNSVTFTATPVNGGISPVYQWKLNGTDVGTNSATYTTSALIAGDVVTVTITSNATCASPATANGTAPVVTIRPPAPAAPDVATGTTVVCPSVSGFVYSIPAVPNATTYTWTVPGGWTIASGQSTTSITASTQSAAASGNISVYASNVCGSGPVSALPITVSPAKPATPVITGTASVCPGISSTIYSVTPVANADPNGYVWTVPAGWIINSGQGTISISTTSGSQGDDGNITVTASNSCGVSNVRTYAVTVKPAIPAAPDVPSGNATVCPSISGLVYSVPAVPNATSYLWTIVPSGWNITSGSTTNTLTAQTYSVATSGDITVVAKNNCGTSPASVLAITVSPGKPATPGTITGTTPVCPGISSLSYSIAAVPNATNYTWTVPSGWNITSGQGTANITVTSGAYGDNGNITVVASNSCGTSAAASKSVTISPGTPATPGAITGLNEQCVSKSSLVYSIAAVPNATSYSWSVPAGWTISSGGTSATVTLATTSTAVSGNISVTAINSCGTSTAQTLAVTVRTGAPSTPSTPSPAVGQSNSICPTATGLVYSIPAVPNTTSYTWNVPAGWTITSGQGTTSIVVTASPQPTGSKNISVTATNACGSATSANLVVTIGTFANVNAGPDIYLCAGATSYNLVATYDPNSATRNNDITWNNPSIGSYSPNGNRYNPAYTIPASIQNGGSVTLTAKAQAEGSCPIVTDDMVLTVLPNPTAAISAVSPVCSGTASTVTFTATPNTTVTYKIGSGANQTINIDGTGIGTLTTANLTVSTTYTLVSVAYTNVTACTQSVTTSTTIAINPVATANAGPAQTVCASSPAVTLAGSVGGSATTGTWSGGTGTFSPNSSALNAVYTPSAAEIAAGSVILTLTSNKPAGPCPAAISTVTITINPVATANAGTALTVCASSPAATLAGTIGGAATTGTWSGGAGSFTPNATTLNAIYTPTASEIVTGNVTLTLTSNKPAGPCPAVTSTVLITINPAAITDAGPDQVLCKSSPNVTLAGSVTAGASTGTWSGGGGTFSPNANTLNAVYIPTAAEVNAGSVTLTLTSADPPGPCPSTSDNIVITFNSVAVATAAAFNYSVCSNATINLNGTVSGTATSGTWSGGAGTFSPNANTLNAVYTPTAAEKTAGSLSLTLTTNDPAGPCPAVSDSKNFTINPQVTVSAGSNQSICSGSTATMSGSYGGGATLGYWMTSGTGTFSNNLPGSIYTPSATDITAGAVTISYRTNDPTGPCDADTAYKILTINKIVAITTQPSNISICATNPADLTVVASGTGLTYQWYKGTYPGTAVTNTSNISGANNATLHFHQVSLSNDGVYYVVVTGTAPCGSVVSSTVTLSVDQQIAITTQPVTQVVCAGATNVTFTVTATANDVLSYQWRRNGVNIGTNSNTLVIPTASLTDAGNYDVIVSGPSGYACANAYSAVAVLTVNANSTITRTSASGSDAQTICINNLLTPITYAIGGGGTGASITSGSLPTGVSGTFSGGVFTISGTPVVSGTFSYTITTTGPCTNNPLSGVITVSPDATLNLTSAAGTNTQTRCVSNAITAISYTIGGSGTGAGISAGSLPAGVTGTYSGGVFTISGTPTVSGVFNYTVSTTGSCVAGSLSGTITVTDNSTLTRTSASGTDAQTKCINTALTTISYATGGGATGASITSGTLPAGVTGSFSGGVFTISGTPTASGNFSYTVTTAGPCVNTSLSGTITINANSTITRTSAVGTDAQTKCINNAITNITYAIGGGGTGASITAGTLPAGVTGSFSGGVFTISGTPTASGTFNYTITTAGPCTNVTATGSITVTANATLTRTSASSTTAQTLCINNPITSITYTLGGGATGATFSGLPAGVTGSVSGNNIIISGTATSAGTFNYTVQTTGSCVQVSATGTLTVVPAPVGGTTTNSTNLFVCSGFNAGYISVTGQVGNITKWQSSVDGGVTWTDISSTASTVSYTNLTQTTWYRAVVNQPTCTGLIAYSVHTIVNVVPQSGGGSLSATASPTQICTGTSTLTAFGIGSGSSVGTIEGGSFDQAGAPLEGPGLWRAYEAGSPHNIEGSANNGTNPFNLTNGPKEFFGPPSYAPNPYTVTYNNNPLGGQVNNNKFMVANGLVNCTLETPIFSLVGLSTASITWWEAYILQTGAYIRMEISTNGGNTYSSLLRPDVTGPVSYASPTNFQQTSVDLSAYAGLSNLRVRFTYYSTTYSSWGLEMATITKAVVPATYTWNLYQPAPATGTAADHYLNVFTANSVTVTPPQPNTTNAPITYYYSLNSSAGGCVSNLSVTVNPSPVITHNTVSPVCSGTPLSPNIVFSSNLSGTSYTYVVSNPGGITGLVTNSNGTISGTPVNPTSSPQTIRFIATGSTTFCPGKPDTVDLVVNPRTSVVLSGNSTICPGTPANITLTSAGPFPINVTLSNGITYNVTSSPYNISVSPAASTTYSITGLSPASCAAGGGYSGTAVVTVPTSTAPIGTWICGVSQDWFNPCNWGQGVVPDNTINVTIPNTAPCSPIIDPTSSYAPPDKIARSKDITIGTAQNVSFAFGKGGDLYVAGNWINTRGTAGFTANTGTVTMMGSTAQTITTTSGSTEAFYNLRINNSSNLNNAVTLNNPATVSGVLTLINGIVKTASNKLLSVTNPATTAVVGGATNTYIWGPIARNTNSTGDYYYPVGNPSGPYSVYRPAIVAPQDANAGTYRAEYFVTLPSASLSDRGGDLTGILKTEHWQIDRTSGATDAVIKLFYINPNNNTHWTDNLNPCPACNVAIVSPLAPSNYWYFTNGYDFTNGFNNALPESRFYTNSGIIFSKPVSSFGDFTFGFANNQILPVHLLSFEAKLFNGNGNVTWTINDSKEAEGFDLEYSHDGRSFSRIVELKASQAQVAYTYLHTALQPGSNYYRLLIKEKGGGRFYSKTIRLMADKNLTIIKGIKPTMVQSETYVAIHSAIQQEVFINLLDAAGRTVGQYKANLQLGENNVRVNAIMLTKGVYTLNIKTADGVMANLRFMKE